MRTGQYQIKLKEHYRQFAAKYPELSPIDERLFDWDKFNYLTVNIQADLIQWKMNIKSVNNKDIVVTAKQGTCLMLINKAHKYNRACIGLEEWNEEFFEGATYYNISNFNTMLNFFLPQISETNMIKDAFFRGVTHDISQTIRQDMRNLFHSEVAKEYMFFDTTKHYEKVKDLKEEVTEDEAAAANEIIYKEELKKHGNKTATAIDRRIIQENTAKRLLKEYGYKYSRTDYNMETAWIDEDLVANLKYFLPEIDEALNKIEKATHINSQENIPMIRDEILNPLCQTMMYRHSMVNSFNSMIAMYGIDPQYNTENLSEYDFLYKNISKVVSNTNKRRQISYKNDAAFEIEDAPESDYEDEEEIVVDRITKDIIAWYYTRLTRLRTILGEQYYNKLRIFL